MSSILMFLFAGLSWDGAPPPKTPAEKPVQQKAIGPEDLLKQHRERMLIEEHKMQQVVKETLDKANRNLVHDPAGTLEDLRNMRNRVLDHPDLGSDVRTALAAKLHKALRELGVRQKTIKLEEAKGKFEEAKLALMVAQNIAKAESMYEANPKKALNVLREAVLEVWDNPLISKLHRHTLIDQLMQARVTLREGMQ